MTSCLTDNDDASSVNIELFLVGKGGGTSLVNCAV